MTERARPILWGWGEPGARGLAAACLIVGVVSIVFFLDYAGFPTEPARYRVLQYLVATQDVHAALVLMGLVLLAGISSSRVPALRLLDFIARHPWKVAAIAFGALCLGALYVEHNHPLAQDEYAALFQSRVFAAGRLTGRFPPELLGHLIPPIYLNQFLYGSFATGEVASAYWPGFALLLAPFSFLHVPWACNPLLASLALVLMAKIATRLGGEPRAGGWAMLLALASPGFTGMALTYFSMTAHLLLNLVFAWLLLERTPRRLMLAGAVGSLALLLHNPLPHTLFALPWIAWLALQPTRRRDLLALAAGYAPATALVGLGWPIVLAGLQGNANIGLFPFDDNPFHRLVNFFWGWHIKLRTALAMPSEDVRATRLVEMLRLWNWAVPGLALLAAAGWWLKRHNPVVLLLGASLLATAAGYLFIGFTQGYGWGARYFHPAWGALPVLAALALAHRRDEGQSHPLARYVASLAVLSLVFATGLRAIQIDRFVTAHLALRPPLVADARQVVLVTYDWWNYAQDLVQNDPFLRDSVWYMQSFGEARNADFMRARFPGAQRVFRDSRGEVWRLPPH